ncbi:hypothetical protein FOL46_000887 [Perkinsus olseni]|uniref:Aspartate/ornithine carbamoyltransferase carbamoyl-P binding domain-containing protein n=1 Tax=Perkinsus olseni TaxID=32597 RepID=A0A7J6MGR9_PEROL|nr:hypothetical protein FOL46_000887 [Perkinsus olseni]
MTAGRPSLEGGIPVEATCSLERLLGMDPRSLCVIDDLSVDERRRILADAMKLKEVFSDPVDVLRTGFRVDDPQSCVYSIFMENSTRTKESFLNAAKFHDVKVNIFDCQTSSFLKSETITDTIKMLIGYSPAGRTTFVIRSKLEGVCRWLEFAMAKYARLHGIKKPIFINAGDGSHEHPTQELLDQLTFVESIKRLNREAGGSPSGGYSPIGIEPYDFQAIHVALIGDLKNGRTVHSKVNGLRVFDNVKVDLIAPGELGMPEFYTERMRSLGYDVRQFPSLDEYLDQDDVAKIWYFTRLQLERMTDDQREKSAILWRAVSFDATTMMGKLPDGCKFFHPLPRDSRFPTIPFEIDDTDLNGWDEQSRNGYFLRIVLLRGIAAAGPPKVEVQFDTDRRCGNPRCVSNEVNGQREVIPAMMKDSAVFMSCCLTAQYREMTDDDEMAVDRSRRPLWWILLLTLGPFGVSFGFALQFALLTPFGMKLGISETMSSYLWLCGPVTGMIVQPLVGRLSDQCQNKWGRRRPYALGGTIVLLISLFLIAWSLDLGVLLGDRGADHRWATLIFVFSFWLFDASNNVLAVVFRALISDTVPDSQLSLAYSFQQCWWALGMISGYFCCRLSWASVRVWASDGASWSVASPLLAFMGVDLSVACPRECALTHQQNQCPAEYVAGCYDLRSAFSVNILVVALTVSIACVAGREVQHIARYRISVRSILSNPLKLCCVDFRALPSDYTLIYVATLLSWTGWFASQIYQSHFAAVELLNGGESGPEYEEAMHVAAGGMLGAAILSGISGLILTVVLRRDCRSTYPLWGVSCLLLGAVLSMAPLLKHVGVGAVATQTWLAAVGPMYAVTCSVPYALVASISHVASSEAESEHPSGEDEGGGAMMGVSGKVLREHPIPVEVW